MYVENTRDMIGFEKIFKETTFQKRVGLSRDLNPGPLAPKARIIPLDH